MTLLERFRECTEPNNLVCEIMGWDWGSIHIVEVRSDNPTWLTIDYVPYKEMDNDKYPRCAVYITWDWRIKRWMKTPDWDGVPYVSQQ